MDRHAVDCLSTFKAPVPCKADTALYPFFLFRFMLTLELMVDALHFLQNYHRSDPCKDHSSE